MEHLSSTSTVATTTTTTNNHLSTNSVTSTAQIGISSSGCPSIIGSGSVIVQGQGQDDLSSHSGLALPASGISEHHHQHNVPQHHRLSAGQQSSTIQPPAPSPAQSPALLKSSSKTCGRNNNGTSELLLHSLYYLRFAYTLHTHFHTLFSIKNARQNIC